MELISVQVPKTAGSAFGKILARQYSGDELLLDEPEFVLDPNSLFQRYFDLWKYVNGKRQLNQPTAARCVHGHFWIGKYAPFFPKARKIIFLREPIQRVISHYFYWKGRALVRNSLQQRLIEENLSLLEFAALPQIRNIVSATFIRDYDLSDFDFVGFQEFFAEDLAELARLMGWCVPVDSITVVNRTASREYEEFRIDPETAGKLAELNEQDVRLYERAIQGRMRPAPDPRSIERKD
jgi:hypothetical protein